MIYGHIYIRISLGLKELELSYISIHKLADLSDLDERVWIFGYSYRTLS